jgi:CBS domain-containing protein
MEARVLGPTSTVSHLTVREAVGVSREATIQEAAQAMRLASVSSLLVDGGVAIVTERDLARAAAAGIGPDGPITEVLSINPIRVDEDLSVVDAAAMMLNRDVRHLVVDFADGSTGVISLRDVMAVLLQMTSPQVWMATLRFAVTAPPESWLG